MEKNIMKRCPFSYGEMEYVESWLTDMASQGLFVQDITLSFASFQQGEPKKRRYRALPKPSGTASDDEKAFYAEHQWHFACSFAGLSIFYTDDERAEELFTDATSFRSYTRKFVFWGILGMPFMLYLVYSILKNAIDILVELPPLHLLQYMGITMSLFFFLILAMGLLLWIKMIASTIALMVKIRKATPLQHDRPCKRRAKFNNAIVLAMSISFVGFLVGMGVSHNFPSLEISYEETAGYQGSHPVMLKEIDSENGEIIQKCLDSNIWINDNSISIDNYSDGLFKDIVTVDAEIWEADVEAVVYMAEYYNARSLCIAQRFMAEEIPYYISKDMDMDDIRIDYNGVDYVGYYFDQKDSYQYLFVMDNTRIETVVYFGEKDLLDFVDLYVEDIKSN